MRRKSIAAVGALLALVVGGAACSDDGDGDEDAPSTEQSPAGSDLEGDGGGTNDMSDTDGGFGGSETTDIDDESRGGEADDNESGGDGDDTGAEDGG